MKWYQVFHLITAILNMIGRGFCYVSYFLTPRCSTEMFWCLGCKVHFELLCKFCFCSLQELERYRKLAMRKARDTSKGTGTEKHSRWNTAASSWFQTTLRHFRTALAGCVWYDELIICLKYLCWTNLKQCKKNWSWRIETISRTESSISLLTWEHMAQK